MRRVSILWVNGNEMVNIEAKTAFDDVIHPTDTPRDLTKWLTTKAIESQSLKWKESINEMKEIKSKPEWTEDTERLERKNQVIITRMTTEYTRAIHSYITNCLFCNTKNDSADQ
jgi:hypothetical protein